MYNSHGDGGTPIPKFDFTPIGVGNLSFLVDRLYADCSTSQFVRELTQNSIESIIQSSNAHGKIWWSIEERVEKHTRGQVQKLCIIDNGGGMTGPELVALIGSLSSSIHPQSINGNFGVGAKISTLPANPAGVFYMSWVNGTGAMIHVRRNENGEYGLKRFPTGEFWFEIDDDFKPAIIQDHGTMVVLGGMSDDSCTNLPPAGAAMPKKWILRFLNSRYFTLPSHIEVSAIEGWDLPRGNKHRFMRRVTGMESWLVENSESFGTIKLACSGVTALWYIAAENADRNTGHYMPPGHVGALYNAELYDVASGSAGYSRLQAFGVIFGGHRVVIYIQPDDARSVTSNTARTIIAINNQPLSWSRYAKEFRENMPCELIAYQELLGHSSHAEQHPAISDRLKRVSGLYTFPLLISRNYTLAPTSGASALIRPHQSVPAPRLEKTKPANKDRPVTNPSHPRVPKDVALDADQKRRPTLLSMIAQPEVVWLSTTRGTRAPDQLEGRAATYSAERNEIYANADFSVFRHMIARWEDPYSHIPGAIGYGGLIERQVQEWFAQQLIEAVMSAHALKQTGQWSSGELLELWGEIGLTAAVLPRYHVDASVRRRLHYQLGPPRYEP